MARIESNLMRIVERVDPAVHIALQDTANFVLTLVRVFAPVDTGWLRDSYRKEVVTPTHIIVGSMVNYALFQEYGTPSRPIRYTPHLTPAFHQAGKTFERALAARLKDLG
jgi:hypothetical protein